MAALEAIKLLGYPLDRIVHAEVWATDTIPADLPPMVEFKSKADKIIKQRYGIDVEHICAVRGGRTSRKGSNERCIDCDSAESCGAPEKLTYEKMFYHIPQRKPGGKFAQGSPNGFPLTKGAWCNDRLKTNALDAISRGGVDGQLRDFLFTVIRGATGRSNGVVYGFPISIGRGNWCTGLKKSVFETAR